MIDLKKWHWRNILFFSLTFLAAVILIPLYLHYEGAGWGLWAMFIIGVAVTNLSITAGYHRYLAHRSYAVKPWLHASYLIVGAGAFQAPAIWWASEHRRHHRFVDTKDDPHNINEGFFHAHLGWMLTERGRTRTKEYAPDLMKDKWVVWQDENYLPLAVGVGFVVPLLIGWAMGSPFGGLLFGGLLRVVVSNHCTFLINSLAHSLGTRPYSDTQTARDSVVMAVLAFGEGYHNFHHAFAADYRNGIRWYHWDPTKWLIRFFHLFGSAYRLRRTSPEDILRARLQNEQIRLVSAGMAPDRVAALKQRVENAQERWRALVAEYHRLKNDMQERSRTKLEQLKAEIKVSRAEFRAAWRQWCSYRRSPRVSPQIAGWA